MTKLYHYTDGFGLDGIFFDKKLWVSLVSKSRNDKSDTTYIKQIVSELKEEITQDNLFMTKALEVINSVLNPRGYEAFKDVLVNNIFMFCVNETDNDEEMMGEFGAKKIIFNKEGLLERFDSLQKKGIYFSEFAYSSVFYDVDIQKEKILSIIKNVELEYIDYLENGLNKDVFFPIIASTPANDYSGNCFILYRENNEWHERTEYNIYEIESQSKMWTHLSNQFYRIAPFIKNPIFSHEKEIRFSFYREKNNFDYLPLHNDKYIVLDLKDDCLFGYVELDK